MQCNDHQAGYAYAANVRTGRKSFALIASAPRLNCHQNVAEITEDGAPSGRRDFMIWSPPLVDPEDPALGHKSALVEAVRLARVLMERGVRIIVFCTVCPSLICPTLTDTAQDQEIVRTGQLSR